MSEMHRWFRGLGRTAAIAFLACASILGGCLWLSNLGRVKAGEPSDEPQTIPLNDILGGPFYRPANNPDFIEWIKLQYFPPSPLVAGLRPRPDFLGTYTVGVPYGELVFRQPDCSLTLEAGDFSAYTDGLGNLEAIASLSGYQETLRTISGLTPNPPAKPFANGCKDPATGISATRSTVIVSHLANGDYAGATISNSGVYTFVSDQLNGSVTSNYIDTSNGSQTASAAQIATADLNGDGYPDLVVANADYASTTGNTMAVLLGKSDGTFADAVYLPLASYTSFGFTLADLNGDGKIDIVLEAGKSNSVSGGNGKILYFAGKGNGTFATVQTAATINLGSIANLDGNLIAAADVNGDGHLDVVDANGLVFLGNGNGTLTQVAASGLLDTANANATGQYSGIAIADFNRDGKLDLALTETNAGAVAIALGKGNGTFTLGNTYSTKRGPVEVTATDLDGDGNPDLVIGIGGAGVYGPGSQSRGGTTLLLGKGDGSFAWDRYYPLSQVASVAAPFHGGDQPDVLSLGKIPANPDSLTLNLSTGNSDGSFLAPVAIATPANIQFAGCYTTTLLAADLNDDGKQDAVLVGCNGNSGAVTAYLGEGEGKFESQSAVEQIPGSPSQAVLGDFNGDGKPDLAVATVSSTNVGQLYYLAGKGDGTFAAPVLLDTYGSSIYPNVLQAIDLNRDGKLDLVVLVASTAGTNPSNVPYIKTYLGKGDGTFTGSGLTMVSGTTPPTGFGAGDVNGDGIPDLVVAQGIAGKPISAYLFLGKGNGTYETGTPLSLGNDYLPVGKIVIQDLNDDGKPDLFYATEADHAAVFGNGDGTFSTQIMLREAPGGSFLLAQDIDGDKQTDLLMTGQAGGIIPILTKGYKQPAAATLASATTLSATPNPATTGQSVTLTATLAPGKGATGTPTGTVFFLNGTTVLGSAISSDGGVATLTIPPRAVGKYNLTAAYGGDEAFAGSTSPALALTVTAPPATTTTLVSSAPTADAGAKVTFTATVREVKGTAIPAGYVGFLVDNDFSTFTEFLLNGAGVASFTPSPLAIGKHTVTAYYYPNSNFSASNASIAETIVDAPASIGAFSGAAQTAVYGTAYAKPLVVLVKDAQGKEVPNATVTFAGTGLKFSSATATTNSSGLAQVTATPTTTGSLTATASVSGVAAPAKFSLTATDAILTVTATNASAVYGQALPKLTYTVTGFVNGDTSKAVTGAPVESTTAKVGSLPGTYPISIAAGTLAAPHYSLKLVAGVLTVAPAGATANPAFTPAAGTYAASQKVTLTDSTPNAVLYYTLNGTTPTASSTKYTAPIPVAATTTIQAFAIAPGYTASKVASATYTIK